MDGSSDCREEEETTGSWFTLEVGSTRRADGCSPGGVEIKLSAGFLA